MKDVAGGYGALATPLSLNLAYRRRSHKSLTLGCHRRQCSHPHYQDPLGNGTPDEYVVNIPDFVD